MMHVDIPRILLIIAFVCFVASAIGVPSRISLTPAGLAFWVLALLLEL